MKMKIREVSSNLIESISSCIEKYGFKLNRKSNSFKRSFEEKEQIFDFVFIKERDYIKIKPEVIIKIKAIENIYKEVSNRGDIYRTLGNDLFEILRYIDKKEETGKGEQYYWIVREQKNIDDLVRVIPEYFEETVLPYFDANSSIERVDTLLNKYPRELSIHNWLYPLRANLAIIAAKLNKNKQYDDLVNIYKEELEEAEETFKQEFNMLINSVLVE